MLKQIFERQMEFQKLLGLQSKYITKDVMYHDAITHLVRSQEEIHEAIRLLPVAFGGMGKASGLEKVSNFQFGLEVVDSFLFLINAMNIMGIKPEEFFELVELKQLQNINRIKNKERFKLVRDYPLIIIDGVDGVGKTTICEKLSEEVHIDVMRMNRPEYMADIEVVSRTFNETIDQIKAPIIQDRGFPSSMVYSEYFGRHSKIPNDPLEYLKGLFKDRDVFVFIITANEPFRSDDFIQHKDFAPLQEIYIRLATENRWKIIHNNVSSDDCVAQIISALQF